MASEDRLQIGKVTFSFSEALHLSLQNIRKRRVRSVITAASITLGISFMVVLLMMNALFSAYATSTGGSIPIEGHQYWLVLVSFSVCIISIANSMLIAVHERYNEIGTMKCLGALDQHVVKLFLLESLVISVVGGVCGFTVGAFTSLLSFGFQVGFDAIFNVSVSRVFSLLFLSMGLSIVLGVAATLYPAYRAARLNPVEALRYEI